MAGIGGAHVRGATAFLGSERFIRYSPNAQALWMQLQRIAVDLKCEFLPEEYTTAAIARAWGQPPELVAAALAELTGETGLRRPIVNTLEVQFGEDDAVTLIRARGAREKQPVGWKDETDLARLWNEANPEDLVDVEDFKRVEVNRRTNEGGSQPGDKKRVQQKPTKRTAKAKQTRSKRGKTAPQTLGNVLSETPHLPDRREEKRRENRHSQSERAATASPDLPSGSADSVANDGNGNGNGTDPRLVKRFDALTVAWRQASDTLSARKRAVMFLSADPPRVLAHVLEIDSDVQKYTDAWDELTSRLTKFRSPQDKYHDRAKKLVRATMEG
jgi:hypothetical protein